MTDIPNDAFFTLIKAKSAEEFMMTKDLLGLEGRFNEQNSRELVTTLVVNHKDRIANELDKHGVFEVGHKFTSDNNFESIGRQRYINVGMEHFISKHFSK